MKTPKPKQLYADSGFGRFVKRTMLGGLFVLGAATCAQALTFDWVPDQGYSSTGTLVIPDGDGGIGTHTDFVTSGTFDQDGSGPAKPYTAATTMQFNFQIFGDGVLQETAGYWSDGVSFSAHSAFPLEAESTTTIGGVGRWVEVNTPPQTGVPDSGSGFALLGCGLAGIGVLKRHLI